MAIPEQLHLLHADEHHWLHLRQRLKLEPISREHFLLEYKELHALLHEHLCVCSDFFHWPQCVLEECARAK